jgi:hypothetical protein
VLQYAKEMLSDGNRILAGPLMSAQLPARRIISGSQLYRWIEQEEEPRATAAHHADTARRHQNAKG